MKRLFSTPTKWDYRLESMLAAMFSKNTGLKEALKNSGDPALTNIFSHFESTIRLYWFKDTHYAIRVLNELRPHIAAQVEALTDEVIASAKIRARTKAVYDALLRIDVNQEQRDELDKQDALDREHDFMKRIGQVSAILVHGKRTQVAINRLDLLLIQTSIQRKARELESARVASGASPETTIYNAYKNAERVLRQYPFEFNGEIQTEIENVAKISTTMKKLLTAIAENRPNNNNSATEEANGEIILPPPPQMPLVPEAPTASAAVISSSSLPLTPAKFKEKPITSGLTEDAAEEIEYQHNAKAIMEDSKAKFARTFDATNLYKKVAHSLGKVAVFQNSGSEEILANQRNLLYGATWAGMWYCLIVAFFSLLGELTAVKNVGVCLGKMGWDLFFICLLAFSASFILGYGIKLLIKRFFRKFLSPATKKYYRWFSTGLVVFTIFGMLATSAIASYALHENEKFEILNRQVDVTQNVIDYGAIIEAESNAESISDVAVSPSPSDAVVNPVQKKPMPYGFYLIACVVIATLSLLASALAITLFLLYYEVKIRGWKIRKLDKKIAKLKAEVASKLNLFELAKDTYGDAIGYSAVIDYLRKKNSETK